MRYLAMIFFILCSLVFAQPPTGITPSHIDEDSIHFVGQASAFTVGSELVTNGTFTTDTAWPTKGTGWTIAGGVAVCDGTVVGSNTDITQVIASGFTVGRLYRMQFELVTRDAGTVTARFDAVEIGDKTVPGVYTGYGVATGAGLSIDIRGDEFFEGTVDNVSVVPWVGDLNAGGGTTIAGLKTVLDAGGDLADYMTPTGGVLHHEAGLALSVAGGITITLAAWDQGGQPKVGTNVNVDFSAPLTNIDDGIFTIVTVTATTIVLDEDPTGIVAQTAEIWVGGAYPDIATAMNDSTLSEETATTYRKRHIVVNVDQEVDAVTDFVAETSETTLREDDGSRKIIGFYDSISVVQPAGSGANDGYRVVSDMDEGQTYYGGARKAFNSVEGFPEINPNGKWIEWNAKGNAMNVIEWNSSNPELRNLKVHNTITGASEGLIITDTALFNATLVNCWFATSSRFQVNDATAKQNSVVDCYFDTSLEDVTLTDWQDSSFLKCIFNGTDRSNTIEGVVGCSFGFCTVYKGAKGILTSQCFSLANCTVVSQTQACVQGGGANTVTGLFYNNIFSPAEVSDVAIKFASTGSMSPVGLNNIMFCVAAGAVLTNPVTHGEITPNPPLPIGTLEVDPQFVNFAAGDYRLRASSPALNGGVTTSFGGPTTAGAWAPYANPFPGRRPRHAGTPIYR